MQAGECRRVGPSSNSLQGLGPRRLGRVHFSSQAFRMTEPWPGLRFHGFAKLDSSYRPQTHTVLRAGLLVRRRRSVGRRWTPW